MPMTRELCAPTHQILINQITSCDSGEKHQSHRIIKLERFLQYFVIVKYQGIQINNLAHLTLAILSYLNQESWASAFPKEKL